MSQQQQEEDTTTTKDKVPLIQLAENTMVQSMIAFLLADLRILSATGKISTRYEHLFIDSDYRLSRKEYANEVSGVKTSVGEEKRSSCGITSAHIMAILFLEITRTAEELRDNEDKRRSTLDDDVDSHFVNRKTFKKSTDIPTLLGSYRDMMQSDIVRGSLKIKKDKYEFLSTTKKEEYNATAKNDCIGVSASFNPDVGTIEDEEASPFISNVIVKPRQRVERAKSAINVLRSEEEKIIREIEELDDQIFHISKRTEEESESEYYTKQEVIQLLEDAIRTRDDEKIKIIENFFKDGSITKNLLQSKAETVWMNDFFPAYECTYAISINREEKNVLLAFRGASTRTDWSHCFDTKVKATSNPIEEDYPDRSENIKLYSGIHRYLFRVRKDTKTTKYDEIASKLAYYCNLVGDGVRVTVTGHSLGAALTNIFAFYASTNDAFTKNGPIETVTFGGPMVGGYKFADAVRHQEDAGKLRIARFHCVKDATTCLPIAFFWSSKRGAKYFHNGINIKLPLIRKGIFRVFGQPLPGVAYSGKPKSKICSWLYQIRSFYLFNIPLRFWLIRKMHSLIEHKERLLLIEETKNYERSPLVRYSLEELYSMRHELGNGKRLSKVTKNSLQWENQNSKKKGGQSSPLYIGKSPVFNLF